MSDIGQLVQVIKKHIKQYEDKPSPDLLQELPLSKVTGFVFRAIRKNERPELGLVSRKPNRDMTISGHIRNGNRHKGSQFISTSKDQLCAAFYGLSELSKVVQVDLSKIRGNVYDCSTRESEHLQDEITANFAVSCSEVLVEGYIPPEAIVRVFRFTGLVYLKPRPTVSYTKWKNENNLNFTDLMEEESSSSSAVSSSVTQPTWHHPSSLSQQQQVQLSQGLP